MGRGRSKAMQAKIARELKYSSINTDFTALQKELAGSDRDARFGDDTTPDDTGVDEGRYGR